MVRWAGLWVLVSVELNLTKAYFGIQPWKKEKINWSAIAEQKWKIIPNQCPKCKDWLLKLGNF